MLKRLMLFGLVMLTALAAVGAQAEQSAPLADGLYSAEFITDSGMFHANEADAGLGVLTVTEGEMCLHIRLASKSIVNLFPGTAEQAQAADAVLLESIIETVTYADGYSEEVYAFDVPVPALEEEFPLALVGLKGKWYDHMVKVSNPLPLEAEG